MTQPTTKLTTDLTKELAVAIAVHLEIHHDSISRVEVWENVVFVVIKGKGARFVTKRVLEINAAYTKSTQCQVVAIEEVKRVAVNLYEVTVKEKKDPKNLMFSDVVFSTYSVTRDEAVHIWGNWITEFVNKVTQATLRNQVAA